jgi:hypothetical protein
MLRSVLVVLGAICGTVVLLGTCVRMTIGDDLPRATHLRVYSLAAVRAMVESDPSRALGLTVRLRAIPVRQWCLDWVLPANGMCRLTAPAFVSAGPQDPGEPVVLAFGDIPPLLGALRAAPMMGAIVPRPHVITWATLGIYAVEIERASCIPGESSLCYHAVVLDAE